MARSWYPKCDQYICVPFILAKLSRLMLLTYMGYVGSFSVKSISRKFSSNWFHGKKVMFRNYSHSPLYYSSKFIFHGQCMPFRDSKMIISSGKPHNIVRLTGCHKGRCFLPQARLLLLHTHNLSLLCKLLWLCFFSSFLDFDKLY